MRERVSRTHAEFTRLLADLLEMLQQGHGTDPSTTVSLMRLLTDTILDDARVVARLLEILREAGIDQGVTTLVTRAAVDGDAGAMVTLGLLLAGQDPAEARRWFERAAEAGDAAAMNNLGVLLAEYRSRLKSYLEGQLRDLEAGVTDSGTFPAMCSVPQSPMRTPRWPPTPSASGLHRAGTYDQSASGYGVLVTTDPSALLSRPVS